MKKLTAKVTGHARAHRDLLTIRRSDTPLSEKQAARITARIDNILTQLPAAICQAHERIIGERQVPNGEKILSLYDPDIDIIVRGKAGAEVEFGSKRWLGIARRSSWKSTMASSDWKLPPVAKDWLDRPKEAPKPTSHRGEI
jgi:hypothetical protein